MSFGVPRKVIAIASSTGGVPVLEHIISRFPTDIPPVVIVQHMPPGFTKLLATRMDKNYKVSIKEAQSGDSLIQGQVLIAPAGKHMKLVNHQGKLTVQCFVGQKMHGVMPAADILFDSVAELLRQNAIGVVLTGMGADGARGLLAMRRNGAVTIGQNKETSAIYGMPKVARELGAVIYELPLEQINARILASI